MLILEFHLHTITKLGPKYIKELVTIPFFPLNLCTCTIFTHNELNYINDLNVTVGTLQYVLGEKRKDTLIQFELS